MPAPLRKPTDRSHLSCLIAQNYGELCKRARQLVGREEADDLVQSTVEKALRHLEAFQPDTNMLAWLRRIMSNLMIDQWRRHKRQSQSLLTDGTAESTTMEPPCSSPWEGLNLDDVRGALPGLSRQVRPVFELHLDGLSYQQIADRLGLRASTVGTRLLRGRLQMRRLLNAMLLYRQDAPANDVARGPRPDPAPVPPASAEEPAPTTPVPPTSAGPRRTRRVAPLALPGPGYFCMQSIQ